MEIKKKDQLYLMMDTRNSPGQNRDPLQMAYAPDGSKEGEMMMIEVDTDK